MIQKIKIFNGFPKKIEKEINTWLKKKGPSACPVSVKPTSMNENGEMAIVVSWEDVK